MPGTNHRYFLLPTSSVTICSFRLFAGSAFTTLMVIGCVVTVSNCCDGSVEKSKLNLRDYFFSLLRADKRNSKGFIATHREVEFIDMLAVAAFKMLNDLVASAISAAQSH